MCHLSEDSHKDTPCHGINRYKRRGLPAEALFLFLQRSSHLVLSDAVHFLRAYPFLVALILQSGKS